MIAPAAAADLYGQPHYKAPPVFVKTWTVSPHYVVNQGPVYSGPAIMIVGFELKDTGLRRSYPFIGGYRPKPVRVLY
jgi:hypothetical protein